MCWWNKKMIFAQPPALIDKLPTNFWIWNEELRATTQKTLLVCLTQGNFLYVCQKHPTSRRWSTGHPALTQKMEDVRHHHKYYPWWNRAVYYNATGPLKDHDSSYQRETRCNRDAPHWSICRWENIGWLPFLQGKMSKYWRTVLMATLPKTSSRELTASQWGEKLILALWAFGRNIWEKRNKEIHGHSIQEARGKWGEKLKMEINYFTTKFQENQFLVLNGTDT